VLDGGFAGAHTFPGFRKYVINSATTRVYALLNISVMGQSTFSTDNPHGELLDLRYVNSRLAAQTIERNRDRILGLKVRLTENIAGSQDLEVLRRTCQAARDVRLPVMAHIGGSKSPLKQILTLLQTGDVITHAFRAGAGGILDDGGRVLPEVSDAIARGIRLDVGHGANGFSFETAQRALQQGVLPYTISSDVHAYNYNGPVYDFVTTLSKFLTLGLSLEQVIERATINPARAFAFPHSPGNIADGQVADISVLRPNSRAVVFRDSEGVTLRASRTLEPVATICAGALYGGPVQ
jgi:dihydroorotase